MEALLVSFCRGASLLTTSGEVHRMCDSVVAINRKGDEYVSGGICDHCLKETDELAKDVPSMPGHCYPPGDIRRHVD